MQMNELATKLKVGSLEPGKYRDSDRKLNPRTYFDPAEMDELIASVKVHGVIQTILVRPSPVEGRYEIIAGERRWRAAKVALGDEGEVPVIITVVSDEEARVLASVENHHRAAVSHTEEAKNAAEVVEQCDGNRAEAAAQLGWPLTRLNSRLALLTCVIEVQNALNERKILLGHAELLAAVPADKQASSLQKIIDHSLTVAFVKANLAKVAQRLDGASFAIDACSTCQHNSACQSALFDEHLEGGYCTNSACFQEKTDQHLETLRAELAQEFPLVKIVGVGDTSTAIPITAIGKMSVGEEQAKACRACEKFGCTVSAMPGSVGQVEKNLCFDAGCNAGKVAANLRVAAEAATVATPKAGAVTKSGKGKAKGGKTAAGSTTATAKVDLKVQTPQRVKDYRVKIWRGAAKRELFSDAERAKTMVVTLALTGDLRHASSSKMQEAFKKLIGGEASCIGVGAISTIATAATGKTEARDRLIGIISASAMSEIEENKLREVLTWLQCDLAAHWKLSKDFLDLLTKSEIEAVAEELGLKAHLGDKFAKLAGGKKDEFVKALLDAEGFNYQGAVPAVMQYARGESKAVEAINAPADDAADD